MVEKMKTDVDEVLLVPKLKKGQIQQNILENFHLFSKPKVVYLHPFLSSLPFSKFWKPNLMYFGPKHVETGSNYSHELVTFLQYHMPLRWEINLEGPKNRFYRKQNMCRRKSVYNFKSKVKLNSRKLETRFPQNNAFVLFVRNRKKSAGRHQKGPFSL